MTLKDFRKTAKWRIYKFARIVYDFWSQLSEEISLLTEEWPIRLYYFAQIAWGTWTEDTMVQEMNSQSQFVMPNSDTHYKVWRKCYRVWFLFTVKLTLLCSISGSQIPIRGRRGSCEDLKSISVLQISFDSLRNGSYKSVGRMKEKNLFMGRPAKWRDGSPIYLMTLKDFRRTLYRTPILCHQNS